MPSGAKSRRLLEPFTFFIDRSLGAHKVARALVSACEPGEVVHVHDDHFPQDTTDEAWLTEIGLVGWVVLTKDARIRTSAVERDALLSSGAACFALSRGDLTADQMAIVFCEAIASIRTVLRRYSVPIIATINADAAVTVRYAKGKELRPPKVYRRTRKGD
jgi:hypothetical protein